jgi:hypothetical protein
VRRAEVFLEGEVGGAGDGSVGDNVEVGVLRKQEKTTTKVYRSASRGGEKGKRGRGRAHLMKQFDRLVHRLEIFDRVIDVRRFLDEEAVDDLG